VLGLGNFPGAIKAFSYTRLLQVVNLPDEDPYDKSRVVVAQQARHDFLRHNSYFHAAIQTDSQIDNPHQLVHLNFTVAMGQRLERIPRFVVRSGLAGESLNEDICAPPTRYPPRTNRPQVKELGPSIETRGATPRAGCQTGDWENVMPERHVHSYGQTNGHGCRV
jgi:hypothetical protein